MNYQELNQECAVIHFQEEGYNVHEVTSSYIVLSDVEDEVEERFEVSIKGKDFTFIMDSDY